MLADRVRVLGVDHPDALATRHNLAYWRGQAGDAASAAAAFTDLLADRVRVLGVDHPDALATRHNLAYWQSRLSHEPGRDDHAPSDINSGEH
ncbi:tetratricopeptide repeat protein [Streptomyces sp. NPDC046915]|uniref:tetratricopeptide repeat protein n=1 Tax=Streptomyces sp. NPDC046915 TaxID=3155257 RepID=UPI0033FDC1A8